MDDAAEIGKNNEGIVVSNAESCDNTEEKSPPLSSESSTQSHSDAKQENCEKSETDNTNIYCRLILSHIRSSFGRCHILISFLRHCYPPKKLIK